MAYYMSQRVFNLSAFTLAWAQTLHFARDGERQKKVVIDENLNTYRRMFPEDDFEPELNRAAALACSWSTDLSKEYVIQLQWITSFMQAALRYRPDGSRWPWRPFPFNGRWFRAPRSPPPDRYGQFVKDIANYYLSLQTGKIPLHFLVEEGGAHSIQRAGR
jgi:hypothetical protein